MFRPVSKAVTERKKLILFEDILPSFKSEVIMPGSTDLADVLWVALSGQIITVC